MLKEVQNMAYMELKELVAGQDLPCRGANNEGETVIVKHEKNDGDPRFHLTTVQNNGWPGTTTSTRMAAEKNCLRSEKVG